jgi:Cu-processing system permease protein
VGFGLAGLVLNGQTGTAGMAGFVVVVAVSLGLTAVFLAIAAMIAQTSAERRARVLGQAVVIWFAAVVLYDVALLGAASLLRSGTASRLLMTAAFANPVDAARTVALMAVEGNAAFGPASLALLRFTGGPTATAVIATASLALWTIGPLAIAARRLTRADV